MTQERQLFQKQHPQIFEQLLFVVKGKFSDRFFKPAVIDRADVVLCSSDRDFYMFTQG